MLVRGWGLVLLLHTILQVVLLKKLIVDKACTAEQSKGFYSIATDLASLVERTSRHVVIS